MTYRVVDLRELHVESVLSALSRGLAAGEEVRFIGRAKIRSERGRARGSVVVVTDSSLLVLDRTTLEPIIKEPGFSLILSVANKKGCVLRRVDGSGWFSLEAYSTRSNGYLAGYVRSLLRDAKDPYKRQEVVSLRPCTYLGGHGFELSAGAVCGLGFSSEFFTVRSDHGDVLVRTPTGEILQLLVSGKGEYQTGGGFMGGGFGAMAAAEGMLISAFLNSLTTTTKIDTVLRVSTGGSTGYWYHGRETPDQLNIRLAWLTDKLANNQASATGDNLARQIQQLHGLRTQGILTDAEFEVAKRKVLGDST